MPSVELTVKTILFDLDRTLIDSTRAVKKTIARWCGNQGVDPREFTAAQHGTRARDLLRHFATTPKKGSDMSEEELDAAVDELEKSIGETAREMKAHGEGSGIVALPWVLDLLAKLQAGGAQWGIVTSATRIHAVPAIELAGIPAPPVMVTGEQVTAGKPSPEPYLTGVDRLRDLQPDLTPLDVLVVEDAPAGFESAYAAGSRLLAVCTGPVEAAEVHEAASKVSGAVVVKDLTA
ncbi:haloacid dehalogenase-like hydrolase domain containing protein [Rhodotorula toruloides]|uniref:Haloacid dehalogenase-like hydrolase domain containing protein n=1 Tax=Rhodotorula toruloides TaxID=5286 RepID=A0A511KA05_RHOTO|nr:haloacid dehalogenase-like hydrolase domain containing protein [Rhodotorula toruloides]